MAERAAGVLDAEVRAMCTRLRTAIKRGQIKPLAYAEAFTAFLNLTDALLAEREGAAVVKLETLMAVAGALDEFGPKAPSHTCGAPGAACDFECSVFAGWSAVRREVAAAIRAAGGER